MDAWQSRTAAILGDEGVARLQKARVAVFGLGGVGGHAAEALCRAGVGHLDLVDNDTVAPSNLNRQIFALTSTIGQKKVDVAATRLRDINPAVALTLHDTFFLPDTADTFDFSSYDYVLDAIDTVSGKLELAVRCEAAQVPLIACMGTGNKTDPSRLKIGDVFATSVCPLARIMRSELKKRGIRRLTVVWSDEPPLASSLPSTVPHKKSSPGSLSFVPSVAGLLAAGEIVRALAGKDKE